MRNKHWNWRAKKNNADEQIKTLRVLAELHHDHQLAAPPGAQTATAALYYLNQALKIAESVSG